MAIDKLARSIAVANAGGGSSEPESYIKDASVSGDTLTLTKKDDTTVTFTDSDTTYTAGSNVDITDGVISATDTVYTLPTASTSQLGGVKVDGTSVTIADGVISASGGGGGSYTVKAPIGLTSSNLLYFIPGEDGIYFKKDMSSSMYGLNIGSKSGDIRGGCLGVGGLHTFNVVAGGLFSCGHNNTVGSGVLGGYQSSCMGIGLTTPNNQQNVVGSYNIEDNNNDYQFIVGVGTSSTRANGFTVSRTGNGNFAGTVTSAGSDYAEYFEWLDENPQEEDRVGYIVKLNGDKIEYANEGDDVLGIISGTATVLGDNPEWNWQGKYIRDDFGRIIYDIEEQFLVLEEGEEPTSMGYRKVPRLNPNYNPDIEYIKRSERAEWSAVGMMGKLYVRDDGTAAVNDYVKPSSGIATKSETKTNMRVLERVNENIIRVLVK